MDGYELFDTSGLTVKEVIEICDDALANGFEFIVSNGRLYFKENE